MYYRVLLTMALVSLDYTWKCRSLVFLNETFRRASDEARGCTWPHFGRGRASKASKAYLFLIPIFRKSISKLIPIFRKCIPNLKKFFEKSSVSYQNLENRYRSLYQNYENWHHSLYQYLENRYRSRWHVPVPGWCSSTFSLVSSCPFRRVFLKLA